MACKDCARTIKENGKVFAEYIKVLIIILLVLKNKKDWSGLRPP